MSRGDRSRPERSPEERERDREERERRRHGRTGSRPTPSPAEPTQDEPAPVEEEEDVAGPGGALDDLELAPPALDTGSEPADGLSMGGTEDSQPADGLSGEPVGGTGSEPAQVSDADVRALGVGHFEDALRAGASEMPDIDPAFQSEPASPLHSAPASDPASESAPEPTFDPDHASTHDPDQASTHDPDQASMPDPAPVPATPLLSEPPRALPPLPLPPRAAAGGASAAAARTRGGRSFSRIAALVALVIVLIAVVVVVYSLSKSSTPKPVAAPTVVKVLIPEGKTRVQIAQIAKAAGLKGSYRSAARSSTLLNPARYGAPHGTPDLEGFLFPATYELDRGAPASELVQEQLTAFRENFGAEDVRRAKALHVTPYQLLIVASMIEREAQVPGDRSKIAAVIYNRLADGMPLGIDASIYYAVEEQQGIATYTHELTESQLHIDSPYNTRTHTGLPPTPISNPGVASIHAAAHPAHVAYLYYVAGADGCGEQLFSNGEAEFATNAAAYEAAVKANGGHPPRCKHK